MVMMGLQLTGKLPFKEVGVLMCVFYIKYLLYFIFGAPGATKFKSECLLNCQTCSQMYQAVSLQLD